MKFFSILRKIRTETNECKKPANVNDDHTKAKPIKRIIKSRSTKKTIEMVTIKKYGMDMIDDRLYTRRKTNHITIVSIALIFTYTPLKRLFMDEPTRDFCLKQTIRKE